MEEVKIGSFVLDKAKNRGICRYIGVLEEAKTNCQYYGVEWLDKKVSKAKVKDEMKKDSKV